VNTRDSLGFPQDRHEVPLATGIAGSPNGGRGSDLTILSGIWTHASRRLLLNAQQSTHSSQLLLFSKFRLHFYHFDLPHAMPRSGSPLVSPIEGTHRRRAAAVEHQSV